jgi:hypothetical protein
MTLNGVPQAPTDVYVDGIARIAAWCRANDVNLEIRCKPSYSIVRILSAYVGADPARLEHNLRQTMEEYLRNCDLCLLYDAATTGALYFLRNSIPLLNPVVTAQTKAFLANVHPDVIVPQSVQVTLQRLEEFKSDPLAFYSFRAAQFHAYLSLFQKAQPLRVYL